MPPAPELCRRLHDKAGQPFTVRDFAPADRRALEEMYAAFRPKRAAQGLPPGDDASVRRWLDRVLPNGRHYVVELDGGIVGHAMLIPIGDETVELATFLHQHVRDRGIGTALHRIAMDVARADGFRRAWLSVEPSNRMAIRSYEKVGFRRMPGFLWAPELEMDADLDVACGAGASGS